MSARSPDPSLTKLVSETNLRNFRKQGRRKTSRAASIVAEKCLCSWCGSDVDVREALTISVGNIDDAGYGAFCRIECLQFALLRENPAEIDLPLELLPEAVGLADDQVTDWSGEMVAPKTGWQSSVD